MESNEVGLQTPQKWLAKNLIEAGAWTSGAGSFERN